MQDEMNTFYYHIFCFLVSTTVCCRVKGIRAVFALKIYRRWLEKTQSQDSLFWNKTPLTQDEKIKYRLIYLSMVVMCVSYPHRSVRQPLGRILESKSTEAFPLWGCSVVHMGCSLKNNTSQWGGMKHNSWLVHFRGFKVKQGRDLWVWIGTNIIFVYFSSLISCFQVDPWQGHVVFPIFWPTV